MAEQIKYQNIGFVINPKAGHGRVGNVFKSEILPQLKKKLNDRKITCYLTKKAGDGTRLALKLVEEGHDLVVSCGGDGTNHEVINGLMKSEKKVSIGFIPLGNKKQTSNSFKRFWK